MSATVASVTPRVARFLRDIIRIPSLSGEEKLVVARIAKELRALRVYDKVWTDRLGNVIGQWGCGPRALMLDAHIDTVDIGDRAQWAHDPYAALERKGVIYGRGAVDEKPAMACMAYAPLLLDPALKKHVTMYVVGSVLEEDCDGYPLWHLITKEGVKPDWVVLGEPTDLRVYRGHRGRMEITVSIKGKAAHGAHCDRGVNAIYRTAPIILEIEQLHKRLRRDALLGKGSVTIARIESRSPSLCSVADGCTLYLDRRLTRGETKASALAELRALPGVRAARAHVAVREYRSTAWTGLPVAQESYFPTWVLEDKQPLVQAGLRAAAAALPARTPTLGVWTFSTNGVATMGRLGIPTIGFAPGREELAHSVHEQVTIKDLAVATHFYAALVRELCA